MSIKQIAIFVAIFLMFALFTNYAKAAEGFYFEAGISIHDTENDYPEVNNMPNPLGDVETGYTIKYKKDEFLDIFINHTSSISYKEDGYGLNKIGISYRSYL